MEKNPYITLAGAFAGGSGGFPPFRLGKVTGTEPLTVNVAGAEISEGIYINAALLPDQTRKYDLTEGTLTIRTATSSVSGKADGQDLVLKTKDLGIAAGDEVLLMSGDDQTFILICKVVKP